MLRKSAAANPSILEELFNSFIEDSNELALQLKDSITSGDSNGYASAVHTMKGLCGTIGCTRLFEILKTMDGLNKNNDFQESENYMKQLEIIHFDTVHVIQTEILQPPVV